MTTLDIEDLRFSEYIDSRDIVACAAAIREECEEQGREPTADEQSIIDLDDEAPATDWIYGATLIREDKFTDYAQELAEDIGAIDCNANWPLTYIDWNAAADALKADYTTIEVLGHDYLART